MKKLAAAIVILLAGLSFLFAEGLSEEEKAMFKKNVVVPLPSEIIMAMDNITQVNWKNAVSFNYSAGYEENYKIALNLGVKVADGFIAIQAKDKRNIGEMFDVSRTLAGNFGAERSQVFKSKEQIQELLSNNNWNELRHVLDKLQVSVKKDMRKYHPDFVTLSSIGGWLEGLNVVSKGLLQNYNEDNSTILYQPKLIDHFIAILAKLEDMNKNNSEVKLIIEKMPVIRDLCAVGYGNPIPEENVRELEKISNDLLIAIEKGE